MLIGHINPPQERSLNILETCVSGYGAPATTLPTHAYTLYLRVSLPWC